MADDIVTRLREEHYHIGRDGFSCISCDAADEIERLHHLVLHHKGYTNELMGILEGVLIAGNALHAWITINATSIQQERLSHDKVLEAWEEVRRG